MSCQNYQTRSVAEYLSQKNYKIMNGGNINRGGQTFSAESESFADNQKQQRAAQFV